MFWVKFFPALFGALTLLVVWKIVEELGGGLFALVLASLAILASAVLRINILFQPNSLDIFFWTLVYFTIIKYIRTHRPGWLYAIAVTIAFGFLSKYNIVFLVLGLLPAILLTGHRKVFLSRHLYIGLGVGFIIVLPNLIWQYRNNFPTLDQLNQLSAQQLVNVNRFDFIKEQVLFFINSFFILIAAFFSFFLYPPFKKYRLFFWSYAFTISLFIFLKAKSYYAIGLYPLLIAFGTVYLENLFITGCDLFHLPNARDQRLCNAHCFFEFVPGFE